VNGIGFDPMNLADFDCIKKEDFRVVAIYLFDWDAVMNLIAVLSSWVKGALYYSNLCLSQMFLSSLLNLEEVDFPVVTAQ